MKILKPGKVEQRKFACKCCGCEFVADISERTYSLGYYVRCPQCKYPELIWWSEGEPYEEPVQDYKAMISTLSDMIYDGFSADEDTATEIAAMLVANGVTFREA